MLSSVNLYWQVAMIVMLEVLNLQKYLNFHRRFKKNCRAPDVQATGFIVQCDIFLENL